MAPATHSCDPPSSNLTIARECGGQERAKPYNGRNMLHIATLAPPRNDMINAKRDDTDPTTHKPLNIVKEPAFIAALVLTALILLGGFIVTKLSNTPVPKNGTRTQSSRTTREGALARTLSVPVSPEYETAATPGTPTRQPHPDFGVPPKIILSEPDDSACPPAVDCSVRSVMPDIQAMNDVQKPVGNNTPPPIPPRESWSRPRQGSDASHTTEETSAPADLFSSSSSLSSLTSHSEIQSDSGGVLEEDHDESADEADPEAVVFEVKRGQTQSLELVKGVLVNLPAPSSDPEIVEEERFQQRESAVSLKAPRIPVPALIVTEPSTLSLFTMGSSTSDLSVELGQFPLPPLNLEPAVFWQKLEDEINASLALKRQSRVPL